MDEARWADRDTVISCTIGDDQGADRNSRRRSPQEDHIHGAGINVDILKESLEDDDTCSRRSDQEDQRQWIKMLVQEEVNNEIQSLRGDVMHLNLQLEEAKEEILELYKLVDLLIHRETERVPEPAADHRRPTGAEHAATPMTSQRMGHQHLEAATTS